MSSVPVGVPVARVPERQHGFIVGWVDMTGFFRMRLGRRMARTGEIDLTVGYEAECRQGVRKDARLKLCLGCDLSR